MPTFGDVVDLLNIPVKNLVLENVSAFPTAELVVGRQIFRTDIGVAFVYTALGWVPTSNQDNVTTTDLNNALATKANANTSIIAGTGLSGGGTLASSRTLNVVYGTGANTAAQGNDPRLSDARPPTSHNHTFAEIQNKISASQLGDGVNSGANGDIVIRSGGGSGALTVVPSGVGGTYLTAGAPGTAPSWQNLAAATESSAGAVELATNTETTTGTDTTRAVTPAGVRAALDQLIAGAPGAMDTLDELAAALGDDPNFRTTILNAIAAKANSTHTHTQSEIVNLVSRLQGIDDAVNALGSSIGAKAAVITRDMPAINAGQWTRIPFILSNDRSQVRFFTAPTSGISEEIIFSVQHNDNDHSMYMRSANSYAAGAIRVVVNGIVSVSGS